MTLQLQTPSKKRDKRKNIDYRGSFYSRSNFTLLSVKQWNYLQILYHMGERELAVAKLACRGINNKEIAEVLNIKVGTVKTHLKNIFSKTRSRNKISMLLRFVDDANKILG